LSLHNLGQPWDFAFVSGGLFVFAHALARHSRDVFEAALQNDLTCGTGDIPFLWERDFRSAESQACNCAEPLRLT
jgi:hypothetical protein